MQAEDQTLTSPSSSIAAKDVSTSTIDKSSRNTSLSISTSITLDAECVLALWRAVLGQVIMDTVDECERPVVAKWLHSKDFRTVCDLADVDGDSFQRELGNLLMIPSRALRLHYSKKLKSHVEG